MHLHNVYYQRLFNWYQILVLKHSGIKNILILLSDISLASIHPPPSFSGGGHQYRKVLLIPSSIKREKGVFLETWGASKE